MDKRVNELRDRLWKKKAALQQKESLPVSGRRQSGAKPGVPRAEGLLPGTERGARSCAALGCGGSGRGGARPQKC